MFGLVVCVLDLGEGWDEGGTKHLPWDIFIVFICFLLGQTKDIFSLNKEMSHGRTHLCFNLRPCLMSLIDYIYYYNIYIFSSSLDRLVWSFVKDSIWFCQQVVKSGYIETHFASLPCQSNYILPCVNCLCIMWYPLNLFSYNFRLPVLWKLCLLFLSFFI